MTSLTFFFLYFFFPHCTDLLASKEQHQNLCVTFLGSKITSESVIFFVMRMDPLPNSNSPGLHYNTICIYSLGEPF